MKLKENKAKSLVDNAIHDLIDAIENGHSVVLKQYFKAMGNFHSYSFTNIMLIARQFHTATKIAGFHTWRKLERHVLKGEKAIKIIAPLVRKNDNSVSTDKDIFGFRVVNVFDISQTDGKELPEISKVKGDPTEYSNKLNQLISENKIELEYSDNIAAYGCSTGGKITIKSGLSPAEDFSVRVHELAHELLHQKTKEKLSKKQKETEAEAVAFVVCSSIGLDTNSAFTDYIQKCTKEIKKRY